MHSKVTKGQILSSAGAAMPVRHALHPVVGRQSQRPPPGKGMFVPFLWGCVAAALALEIWIGLDPHIPILNPAVPRALAEPKWLLLDQMGTRLVLGVPSG